MFGKTLPFVSTSYSFPQESCYIWFDFLVCFFPKLISLFSFSFVLLLSFLFRLAVICIFTYKLAFILFCLRRIAHFGYNFEAVSILAYIFLLP